MRKVNWNRVASGEYDSDDMRYRMYRIPDVHPPAWNIESWFGTEMFVNGAASMRDAIAIFEQERG